MQQVGKPTSVGLAVLGQAEKVEHQYLEAGGRADLDPRAGFLVSCVPPIVRHAGPDMDLATGLGNGRLVQRPG
ncbi:MAG: hypothetical protein ABW214_03815 [Terrimicrobiaceae bacterium]